MGNTHKSAASSERVPRSGAITALAEAVGGAIRVTIAGGGSRAQYAIADGDDGRARHATAWVQVLAGFRASPNGTTPAHLEENVTNESITFVVEGGVLRAEIWKRVDGALGPTELTFGSTFDEEIMGLLAQVNNLPAPYARPVV